MAIRFDAAADLLSRTTVLPGILSFTLMGWFYIVTDRNTWSAFFTYGDSTGVNVYNLGTGVDGTTLDVWNGSAHTAGSALSVGTWVHLAFTGAGTGAGNILGYVNGAVSITTAGNATVTDEILMLGNSTSSDFFNGRTAAIKIYSGVLAATEIQQEMRCYMPVRTANLHTWSPLLAHTDVQNYAVAGGGVWTVGGTLTTETGPPISWSLRPPSRGLMVAVEVVGGRQSRITTVLQAVPRAVAF